MQHEPTWCLSECTHWSVQVVTTVVRHSWLYKTVCLVMMPGPYTYASHSASYTARLLVYMPARARPLPALASARQVWSHDRISPARSSVQFIRDMPAAPVFPITKSSLHCGLTYPRLPLPFCHCSRVPPARGSSTSGTRAAQTCLAGPTWSGAPASQTSLRSTSAPPTCCSASRTPAGRASCLWPAATSTPPCAPGTIPAVSGGIAVGLRWDGTAVGWHCSCRLLEPALIHSVARSAQPLWSWFMQSLSWQQLRSFWYAI